MINHVNLSHKTNIDLPVLGDGKFVCCLRLFFTILTTLCNFSFLTSFCNFYFFNEMKIFKQKTPLNVFVKKQRQFLPEEAATCYISLHD
jgi:hypothetical protein